MQHKRQMAAEAPCVLLIEDDDDLREVLAEILRAAGYAVSVACQGEEALAQLRAGQRPCLILLDLMMPVMDGWTFCEETQKDPALAAIPILVLSAVSRQHPRNSSIRAVGHLTKPLNISTLLATVQQHCLGTIPV